MQLFSRFTAASLLFGASLVAQGPLVLMGIDAEDGGPNGHGPITAYASVISNPGNTGVLDNVTNNGFGILVIGGGKSPTDNVTRFWNAIDTAIPATTVTYVNGAAIGTQSFNGFAMLAIVSDFINTPSGGLTNAENTLLSARSADVATFVNGGGGLLGFSSNQLQQPYGYLGAIGAFTFASPSQFSVINPTPQGLAIGITTQLNVCCWHDEYLTFPGFLDVLARNANTNNPCAIGGSQVVIVQGIVLTPGNATACVGANHQVTANVATNLGVPIPNTNVTFDVIAGPNLGVNGAAVTNAQGRANFRYTSTVPGTDTIEACFIDNTSTQICTTATVTWAPLPSFDPQTPCGQALVASIGVPISFPISALATTGLPGNQITLDATGTPTGATHTPVLPVVAVGPNATATTQFDWVPAANQVGTHIITYTATDNCNQSVTCSVRIDVGECYLLLGLSQANYALGTEVDDVLRVWPLAVFPVSTTSVPPLVIPNDPGLVGLPIYSQVGMINPVAYPNNPLQLSNGLRLVVGQSANPYGQVAGVRLFGPPVPALGTNYDFFFTIQ